MAQSPKELSDADYQRIGDFRYALRRFLTFSKEAAKAEGLTPQQHQALLAIRSSPQAKASIGRLAERLCVRPNSAVELADRLEAAGLISRTTPEADRRKVELALTPAGSHKLERLTLAHRHELSQISPEIVALLGSLNEQKTLP